MMTCPNCGTEIRGKFLSDEMVECECGFSETHTNHCEDCQDFFADIDYSFIVGTCLECANVRESESEVAA